jgi:hypothetical protein
MQYVPGAKGSAVLAVHTRPLGHPSALAGPAAPHRRPAAVQPHGGTLLFALGAQDPPDAEADESVK